MSSIRILWVDDEVELLKPHFLFLTEKGYDLTPCKSGQDAIELIKKEKFQAIMLDENMPGLSGIETLNEIKILLPNIPILMITKNEEEELMEQAIGSKISDYLIKPVNPNQILLALKKLFQHKDLIAERTIRNYQKEFLNISTTLLSIKTIKEWQDFYMNLLYWEFELESINNKGMMEIFKTQKKEANHLFARFIESNYKNWILSNSDLPLLSNNLLRRKVFPIIKKNEKTLFLLIDNLRYDQWKVISNLIEDYYQKQEETPYCSIIPTSTQYSRNAIFSGMTPEQTQKTYPEFWVDESDEKGKNLYEKEFLEKQLKRLNLQISFEYHKILNLKDARKLLKNFDNNKHELITVVYNFVDIISHAKIEMDIIKELASDDKAFRSLTLSWFKNSPLFELIQKARDKKYKLIVTTDHGTINVLNPQKIIGDRNTNVNLRYKKGKTLTFNQKEVFFIEKPIDYGLPASDEKYIFAKNDQYFIYQNNFNKFALHYKNTFQHGGISMEEMIIPIIILNPK
ncbi:MAG: two-component system response regulator [Flavobacteriaceae bacterium]|nr:two-component system response regulator [Flavobacteriaceae bacterium]|tara:strand:+ start:487 stop:2028 length:1542 start_codon:yes stop_codon:yes gene_type:complete